MSLHQCNTLFVQVLRNVALGSCSLVVQHKVPRYITFQAQPLSSFGEILAWLTCVLTCVLRPF
jgi:hypothetical protein